MQRDLRGASGHGRALLAILAVSTLVRLLAARSIPLLDDEAHYWVWSRHLMWGYPDHPPMIAGLVALGTRLAGDSVLGVRLMSVIYGTASTLAIYALTARLFSARAGLRAALLFQALPAFAAGGVMAAPDAALGLYWLLAMLWGWMAIVEGAGWAWPAVGAVAGLVVQSKLAGGALVLSLAGIVLTSRAYRRWLLRPGPYLAVLVGGVVIAPLVGWNLTHDWATVRRALVIDPWVHPVGALGNVAALVGSQFLYYAPLGFPIALAGLIAAARARRDERFRFLWWCAAPTLLIVLLGSVRALSKPHYTGPALVSGIITAAALWPRWRLQRLLRVGVATSAALTVLALVISTVPNPLLGALLQETRAWPRVAREVERLVPLLGRPGEVFLLAETYQGGSQIAFATGNRIPVVVPFRGFDLWEPPSRWIGRNGVLIDHLGGEISSALMAAFARVEGPHVVPVGPGVAVRLYLGIGFRGLGSSRP
ncbi:MAG: glycosyltransferase family 39 protein [Armatimonadota bacterium]|nr:glycosyltransferase family 39 protein [Armatimonadota bacterium]